MSTGGARAKIQSQQQEVKRRCHLPVELQNDFYADVIVIHSRKDDELAQTFLSDIQKHFERGNDYIIVSYLDERLPIENAGDCDFKRCSVAFFIFTENSVKEFNTLTKDKYLDDLLYEGKFVPVLTKPKDKLVLPMRARVPVSLNYFKQTSFQFPRAVLDLLQNNSGTRRTKEKRHKMQVSEYTTVHLPDPVNDTPQKIINIKAYNVIVGDHGTILGYTEGENENLTNSTRTHSSKSNRSQLTSDILQSFRHDTNFSRESTAYPSSYQDETGTTHKNFTSMQTPCASMSYSGDEQNSSKISNRSESITSTPTEDFASVGSGHQPRIASSGRLQKFEIPTPSYSALSSNMPLPVQISPNEELNFTISESFGSFHAAGETSIEKASGDSSHINLPYPQQISCDQSFMSDFHSSVSANSTAYTSDSEEKPNIPWQNEGRTKDTAILNDQSISMKLGNVDRMIKTETPWSSHRYDARKTPKEVTENSSDSLVLRGEGLDFSSLFGSND
ncbi:uncharacterized protein LOC133196420 [Saccostrea echinata]|uniref:uncharacterized protein LOC133196420 n=1 Tax=Saccostrea echinata TaxID=191078 RepID=UPI002A7FA92C|nr:uncharacterized protein LOC133196420 [Saccostrea echinata]